MRAGQTGRAGTAGGRESHNESQSQLNVAGGGAGGGSGGFWGGGTRVTVPPSVGGGGSGSPSGGADGSVSGGGVVSASVSPSNCRLNPSHGTLPVPATLTSTLYAPRFRNTVPLSSWPLRTANRKATWFCEL